MTFVIQPRNPPLKGGTEEGGGKGEVREETGRRGGLNFNPEGQCHRSRRRAKEVLPVPREVTTSDIEIDSDHEMESSNHPPSFSLP